MNILITGGNGYLARNLVSFFPDDDISFLFRKDNIEKTIKESNPDIIIHTICCYGRNNESTTEIYNSNFNIGVEILDNLSYLEKSTSFINCGSSLEKYTNLYSLSKTHLVEYGKFISNQKLQFINMNIEHFYGPQAPNNFLSYIVKECKENKTIPLTKGTQKRDFIYIDDVCSAFQTVIKNKKLLLDFENIDIGTGVSVAIKDVVEKIKKITNSKSQLDFGKVSLRKNDILDMKANVSRLKSLGWKINFNIDEGIEKIV